MAQVAFSASVEAIQTGRIKITVVSAAGKEVTFVARRDLSTLQERVNRILRESFSPESPEEALTTSNFAAPVDVYKDEHNITLKIEVPGIDENDINVSIENNTLTVRGERRFEKDEKEKNFHRVERMYGSFTRSFTLPNTVDPEQVSALYEKGGTHP